MTNENISFGEGLKYCFTKTSYKVILAIATILSIGINTYVIIEYNKGNLDGRIPFFSVGIGVAAIVSAFFIRPSEVAANTTKEQAARGIYIG